MCKLVEDYAARRAAEQQKRFALKLLAKGNSPEETAEILELPLETVLELAQQKSA